MKSRSGILLILLSLIVHANAQRLMENLGRGLIASRTSESEVFLSWRMLGTDSENVTFNLYRDTTLVTSTSKTNFVDQVDVNKNYCIKVVIEGVEQSESFCTGVNIEPYIGIPLEPLEGGGDYVHFVWTGDLDGDGEFDFVVDRLGNGTNKVEAYRRDGTFLWRYDAGPTSLTGDRFNPGAAAISIGHSDGLTVYDIDSDGQAEVIIKTANGSVFGDGTMLENDSDTVQFISILNGVTGAEEARAQVPNDYIDIGPLAGHMGIMYLDGVNPSVVLKGKNRRPDGGFNMSASTYNFEGGDFSLKWKWNRDNKVGPSDAHQIRVIDVDGDGKDELCDGGYVIDDDGTLLYSLAGAIHGDRFHITDFDPDRPGLEGYYIQQDNPSGLAWVYYDAKDGTILKQQSLSGPVDLARGTAGDFYPEYKGIEFFTFTDGIYTPSQEEAISSSHPWPNFKLWWDGDLLAELLNSEQISKWNPGSEFETRLLTPSDYGAVDSWRDAAQFHGDVIGDWREEVIFAKEDQSEIMIFSTTHPTEEKIYTLPHNPGYRNCMNVKGYQQSHLVDYYLGNEMDAPPTPNIELVAKNQVADTETPLWRPQNLTATPQSDSIIVSWLASLDSKVVGYNLYRSDSLGGPYDKLNSTPIIDAQYVDKSITLEIDYYYVITSVDAESNESDQSEEVNAIATQRSDPPSGLSLVASPDSVRLTWKIHDDVSVVGYNIYRFEASGEPYEKLNSELITDTTYLDEQVVNETNYSYVITSVNDLELESDYSEVVTGTPGYSIFLQAEDAELGGGSAHETNHNGYFGTGFVNFPSSGGTALFEGMDGGEGDTIILKYRYANGGSGGRSGTLVVNDFSTGITMEVTTEWSNWQTDEIVVVLNPGTDNSITFETTGQDFGNLDQIVIAPAPPGTLPAGAPVMETIEIQENQAGFCFVDGSIDQTLGVANTDDAAEFGINWLVSAAVAGEYEISWQYYTKNQDNTGRLLLNGTVVNENVVFAATSEFGVQNMSTPLTVTLEEGENEIRLESIDDDGLVDVDFIRIYGLSPEPVACDGEGKNLPPLSANEMAGFTVFPNPVEDGGTIQINSEKPVYDVSLINLNGKLIYKKSENGSREFTINEKFSSGIYVLVLKTENQEFRRKIIVR